MWSTNSANVYEFRPDYADVDFMKSFGKGVGIEVGDQTPREPVGKLSQVTKYLIEKQKRMQGSNSSF